MTPKLFNRLAIIWKKESRKVLKLNSKQINKIDSIVTKGIENGQSTHPIYVTNLYIKSLISEKTLERYIYMELFTAKAFQLPMKARFDPVRKDIIKRELLSNNWIDDKDHLWIL